MDVVAYLAAIISFAAGLAFEPILGRSIDRARRRYEIWRHWREQPELAGDVLDHDLAD